ncbi:MAG: ribosome small subunit-dependent GTPase A [Bacteroidetes bacterium]|nr:MAG: ribosome small subunit-dependent GTPase A [Bacteroidota bacterium]
MEGIVIKSTGSWYKVKVKENITDAKIRGKLRLKEFKTTNPIAVGDRVIIEPSDNKEPAKIVEVLPRKNYIIRRASNLSKQYHIIAANIDQALLVATIKEPYTSKMFIDRFLVAAESFRIPTFIVFNKCDLWEEKDVEKFVELEEIYLSAGYEIFYTSATERLYLEQLKSILKNKITLLSGMSGVGKSSLINAVEPSLQLKTAKISEVHKTGKHTTTFAEMYSFSFGGYLIDTPGIRSFGLADIEKDKLSHYFPEMRKYMRQCKFNNCLHINEPGCAVKEAVANGKISESRYVNYLEMYYDENEKYRKP